MANLILRRQKTIEWGYCDPAGVVLNSRFFEFFDENTWRLFDAALGVKPHELSGAYGIIGIPLVDARANFLIPAKYGDVIEIASQISEFRRSSFDVAHRITIDGNLAIDGGETRVWAARTGEDPDKIGAVAIPPEVIAKFS